MRMAATQRKPKIVRCGSRTYEEMSRAYEKTINFVSRKPARVLFGLLFVVLFFVCVLLPVLGVPELETDLSSDRYLKSDGVISDRHDALNSAMKAEEHRRSTGMQRRLSPDDLLRTDDDASQAAYHITEGLEFGFNHSGRLLARPKSVPERSVPTWKAEIYYRAKEGRSAFDPKVLDDIRAFEQKFESLPSYSKYCLAKSRVTKSCRGIVSATRFFYGIISETNPFSTQVEANVELYVVPNGTSKSRLPIQAVLRKLSEEQVWQGISGRQARDWYFDAKFPDSKIMRSRAWFGLPLSGFDNHLVDAEAQKKEYQKFVEAEMLPMFQEASTENVDILYNGPVLTDHEVFLAVRRDTYFSIGSILFVWIYMSFHLRTPLLAFLGMGIVALSFPMGLTWFRMFGYEQMAIINFLALFLLIGIGADNIFILTDLWRQARIKTKDAAEQLKYTMAKAGKAVMVCGFTTACSFFANGASAVKPVREFGIFVGICVLCNLALCLTLYPPVLVLFERTRKKDLQSVEERKRLYPNGNAPDGMVDDPESTEGPAQGMPEEFLSAEQRHAEGNGNNNLNGDNVGSEAWGGDNKNPVTSFKVVSRETGYLRSAAFLYNNFAPALWRLRFCVIATGGGLTVLFMFLTAFSLDVSREPPEFFGPGDHNLGDVFDLQNEFTNETLWAPAMEKVPLRVCKGCPFMQDDQGSLESGCIFVGALCDTTPCQKISEGVRCSGRGTCNEETGSCSCTASWAGADCSAPRYSTRPSDCGNDFVECSGHGICKDATCWCDLGWTGSDCKERGSLQDGFKSPSPALGNNGGNIASPSPTPSECKWGEWEDWDTCSQTCGFGVQRRNRRVKTPSGSDQQVSNCQLRGSAMDERQCKAQDCLEDCQWEEWGAWSLCDVECGGGYQSRNRSIKTWASGSGASCTGAPVEMKDCTQPACDEVCGVSDWSSDGPCDTTCGVGKQKLQRTIKNPAAAANCPTETARVIQCIDNPACPQTCVLGQWQESGPCSAKCGDGVVQQRRYIKGGDNCPIEDSSERLREIPCKTVICEDASSSSCSVRNYGTWTAWSACDQPCGPGKTKRTRTAPENCPNEPEVKDCQIKACAERCEDFPWQRVTGCSVTCGYGVVLEKRQFGDKDPGDCPESREVPCENSYACPQNCILSGWQSVAGCSTTCGFGQREERKKILMEGANGGTPCPDAESFTRKRTARCKVQDCPGQVDGDLVNDATVSFEVVLNGKVVSMTAAEEFEMRKQIAKFVGVEINEVSVVEVKSRRLDVQDRRMQEGIKVRVVVNSDEWRAERHRQRFAYAVDTGRLHSELRDGPGFDDIGSIKIVKHNIEGPVRTPGSSPAPAPAPRKKAKKAKLPDNMVAAVSVVFGIDPEEPIDRSKRMEQGQSEGAPVWVNEFNFNNPQSQLALWKLCNVSSGDAMWKNKKLAVRKPRCLLSDFNLWLRGRGFQGLPISPSSVSGEALSNFLLDKKGKKWAKYAGFDYGDASKVRWFRVDFVTDLPAKMPATDVLPWLERWDAHIEEWNSGKFREVPSGLRNAFHTCQLWVRAETELRLVKSTLTCAVLSIVFALIAILVFTGNVALAIYLVSVILCIVICLAGLMFGCLGWKFGPVEAIGLIVFVGFSVDYSLHMVEAYNQSVETSRFARTREALLQTGSAVFSAGITSLGAGIFILFCTIKVFVKFGVVVIFNTILSMLFSLVFLCALLMVVGPTDNFGSVPAFIAWLRGKKVDDPVGGGGGGGGGGSSEPSPVIGQVLRHAASDYQWREYDDDPDLKKQKEKDKESAAAVAGGPPGYHWQDYDEDPDLQKQKQNPDPEQSPNGPNPELPNGPNPELPNGPNSELPNGPNPELSDSPQQPTVPEHQIHPESPAQPSVCTVGRPVESFGFTAPSRR